jgi:hypothetical protein
LCDLKLQAAHSVRTKQAALKEGSVENKCTDSTKLIMDVTSQAIVADAATSAVGFPQCLLHPPPTPTGLVC